MAMRCCSAQRQQQLQKGLVMLNTRVTHPAHQEGPCCCWGGTRLEPQSTPKMGTGRSIQTTMP